jgi:hypothetical protein
METKPLLNYQSPNYPRIEVVFSDPGILLKNMPKKWRANKMIVVAMISFSVSACKAQTEKPANTTQQEHFVKDKDANQVNKNALKDSMKIAPIFVHGEGVGASGCVMIAPPVYLSEEEALKIILRELKKEGLSFNDKFQGDSIEVKRKRILYNDDEKITKWEDRYKDSIETRSLYPDAYNKDLKMVIEFVSMKDFRQFADEERVMSSVSEYDIKAVAEKIQKAFKKKGAYNTVVFYDPVGWADRDDRGSWDEMEKAGSRKAVEMLKLQVSDFIDWLKKEKIIVKK